MSRPYLGAVEEDKQRKWPAGMGSSFKFHIRDLSYIAVSGIFLEIGILKSNSDVYLRAMRKIDQ